MQFREWLLAEKAERTSTKVPLYPPNYHTKQYMPLYHTPYAGDYPFWLHAKLEPHTWENFQRAFGKENVPKPTWPIISHDTPAHAEAEGKEFKWSLPSITP
jgi:hypothetical protein